MAGVLLTRNVAGRPAGSVPIYRTPLALGGSRYSDARPVLEGQQMPAPPATTSGYVLRMPTDLAAAEDLRADWSASYNSRVSRRHRFLCMTTPKVACSTVKLALHALEGHPPAAGWWESHDGGEDMRLATFTAPEVAEILDSPEWLRFAFVRNPYERLFSAWKSKIANRWDTQYQPLRVALQARYGYITREGGPDPLIAFRDFVDFVVTGADDTYRGDSHWSAQVDVMWFDTINFDVIGRFETFTEDFCRILRRLDAPESVLEIAKEVTNETPKIPLAAAFDRHLAGRVFEHYRRDFIEFGYPTDSWMYL